MIFIYGAEQDEHKQEFLTELAAVCFDQTIPILIGGDFSLLRSSQEKNMNYHGNRNYDTFNSIINTYELREIELAGGGFTWSNNKETPTLEKLDRLLMRNGWDTLFPLVNVQKLSILVSDHNPLILDTLEEIEPCHKSFRFETSWTGGEDFLENVEKIWNEPIVAKQIL